MQPACAFVSHAACMCVCKPCIRSMVIVSVGICRSMVSYVGNAICHGLQADQGQQMPARGAPHVCCHMRSRASMCEFAFRGACAGRMGAWAHTAAHEHASTETTWPDAWPDMATSRMGGVRRQPKAQSSIDVHKADAPAGLKNTCSACRA